jgi:plasmid maintenance system antidote protein VapI
MIRDVPTRGNEEIDLYMRTYYSLLRSTGDVRIRSLEETHCAMNSSLHIGADEAIPDTSAFVYSVMRLPQCLPDVCLVLMGQSDEVFDRRGYPDVEKWQSVTAHSRRRKMFFDGKSTLAAFIASISDIDDLIPMLTAYQLEWNKLHDRLANTALLARIEEHVTGRKPLSPDEAGEVAKTLGISADDFVKLQSAWGPALWPNLLQAGQQRKDMAIRLLAGSLTDYHRATDGWWYTISREVDRYLECDLFYRPVYFVSSNTHSLLNLLSGYAFTLEPELASYLERVNPENLWHHYQQLKAGQGRGQLKSLLYYALGIYLSHGDAETQAQNQLAMYNYCRERGMLHVENPLYLDVAAQVIDLSSLRPEDFDARVEVDDMDVLQQSDAVIFNVDYPLGMAAYQIFSQVATNLGELQGVYFMGKAATLNGQVGDVMIPNVVYDEHSQNTFLFKNCFVANGVAPYLAQGSVFDNQKAITVRGTFLQNRDFVSVFYKEGYTDIEMEIGPYLSGVYENIYPQRYPVNEIVNLFINAPYDIGVIHYASDTPYSRRQSLLSKSLSYFGVDATYAASIAILRRILTQEVARLRARH